MQFAKIPLDRVGVLVGKEGVVKKEIEERSGAKINIDSKTGDVTIETENIIEPILSLKVADVIKAIGRGFSPEHAFRLFEDDIYFALIDIKDYVGKNKKHIRRVKSRLIGKKGKTRALIEELSETNISIYGNTVGIIGGIDELNIAKIAIDMLLRGSEHSAVYRFLEHKRHELKTRF